MTSCGSDPVLQLPLVRILLAPTPLLGGYVLRRALVLLFLQPCQSSYCYCQEVLDRLIQCGLLVAEEVCSHPRAYVCHASLHV